MRGIGWFGPVRHCDRRTVRAGRPETRRLGRTCRGHAAVGARRTQTFGAWRTRPAAGSGGPASSGRTPRRVRTPALCRWRSACRDADGHASRAIRGISRPAVRREVRHGCDRAHPRKAKSGLCVGRRRARARTPCRFAADAVCHRPDDRLDRPCHRAVRDRSADSAAWRQIRGRSRTDCHRRGLVRSRSDRPSALSGPPTRYQRQACGSMARRCRPSFWALL